MPTRTFAKMVFVFAVPPPEDGLTSSSNEIFRGRGVLISILGWLELCELLPGVSPKPLPSASAAADSALGGVGKANARRRVIGAINKVIIEACATSADPLLKNKGGPGASR